MGSLRKLRIPVVYTAHDVLPQDRDSAEERAFHSRLYCLPDRIIVHTEANRRHLLETFGLASEKVAVVHHGPYDFQFGRGTPIGRSEARRRLEIPLHKKVTLFFGLIKRYKGLEYLVGAFDLVERQLADAYLLVVGNIYRGDVEGWRYYSGLLNGLRRRGNVKTVSDYVPIADVPIYFAATDLVVLPYTHTSQSGVLLAAYGAGRAVVVTETGGLPEIVEPGGTGLIVPPSDADSLARAIVSILGDPIRAGAMGERARLLGETTYCWASAAQRTLETYRLASSEITNRQPTGLRGAAQERVLPERSRPAEPR
jgi:glycosyltransferase involved in cell wall biosynthesis